jgi:transmembrane sensor
MNEQLLEMLGASIAKEQDHALLPEDLAAVEMRFAKSSRRQVRVRVLGWKVLALAAAVIFSGVGAIALWAKPRPIRFLIQGQGPVASRNGNVGAWVSAPESAAVPIQFEDGTRVTVAAGARVRIARADTDGVNIMVERGRLGFNVVHHDGTRWSIASGPFDVTVTGTEFDLKWQPEGESLEVAVQRGTVVVSGCQFVHGRDVRTNEVLRARCGDTISVTTTERADVSEPMAPPVTPNPVTGDETTQSNSDPVVHEAVPEVLSPAGPRWQTLAQKGQYRAAYDVVDRLGFDSVSARASATDLSLLMDVARYAGQSARAESAARLLRNKYSGQPQAAIAAFTMGRLAFDQAQDYGKAGKWFRTYLKEQPGGALAREAEGRLMECLSRTGQTSESKQVAQQYLSRFPDGPHARLARVLLGSDR